MPRPSVVIRPIDDVAGTVLALAWCGEQSPGVQAFCSVAAQIRNAERDLIRRIETASGDPGELLARDAARPLARAR